MSFDAYGRSVISRGGSSPTALRNEEMVRVGNLPYSTSRITDTTMKNNPAYYGETGRHSQVTRSRISSSGGPRRPVKKYNTSMNLDASKSINRTGTSNSLLAGHRYVVPDSAVVRPVYPVTNVEQDHRVSSGRYDSGLGLNEPLKIRKNKKPVKHIPGVVSRCCGSDDDDDLETDHVSGTVKTTSPSIQSLSTPLTKGYLNSYSTSIPTMERQDSAFEQMDIQSPTLPVGGTSFDPAQYQKHLDDIQRRATEWSRLQEGLAMLLPNTDGDTGFHQAVIHNKPNIVSRLLDLVLKYPHLRSSIDDQNSIYQTTLHLAVHVQQIEVIRMLLRSKASLHLQDHKGNTPLHIACRHRSTKCLDELLSGVHRSTLFQIAKIPNYEGQTCAHVAAHVGNTETLLKLRGAGIDINIKEYRSGKTPLHIAVENGSFQLTQLLIQSCNADYNVPTYSGCTPLHIASGRGHLEIVAYLISLGADPYALTDEGDTPYDLVVKDELKRFLESVINM